MLTFLSRIGRDGYFVCHVHEDLIVGKRFCAHMAAGAAGQLGRAVAIVAQQFAGKAARRHTADGVSTSHYMLQGRLDFGAKGVAVMHRAVAVHAVGRMAEEHEAFRPTGQSIDRVRGFVFLFRV